MTNYLAHLLVDSWIATEGKNSIPDILKWIMIRNEDIYVDISKTTLAETGWFYDDNVGQIVNADRSFFQISGVRQKNFHSSLITEQPIIIQNEIGYLGILCKEIDGVLHFLMQAKIEPGNVNKIQISPTIQATKSNFTQRHKGAKPAYLEYFINAFKYTIIVDQIQSEQSSRFLKKRNRNIIVFLDDAIEIDEGPNHKWITLGQIKQLLKIENLINMDTRTVISCIPFNNLTVELKNVMGQTLDRPLIRSITEGIQPEAIPYVYNYINDYKMFSTKCVTPLPLYSLKDWKVHNNKEKEEFICQTGWPFKVVFCDISIEGREVRHWGQPLFEAVGISCFGLFTAVDNGIRKFLVRAMPEIGCFDSIELGPTIQTEENSGRFDADFVSQMFFKRYSERIGVKYDVILSEEGGRFYHEQNRNIIIEISMNDISELPTGYFWLTCYTLNQIVQINNCLNIQLRNLLSLLEL